MRKILAITIIMCSFLTLQGTPAQADKNKRDKENKRVLVIVRNRTNDSLRVGVVKSIHLYPNRSNNGTYIHLQVGPKQIKTITMEVPRRRLNDDGTHNGISAVANFDPIGCEAEIRNRQEIYNFVFHANTVPGNVNNYICDAYPPSDLFQ